MTATDSTHLRRSCMEGDPEERGGTLRECVRAKRTCETQEDRERGLSRNSEREPERRARETQQERRRDLEHARECMRTKRTSETQEDRERRLSLNRKRERERRNVAGKRKTRSRTCVRTHASKEDL